MNYLTYIKITFNDGSIKELNDSNIVSFTCSENLTDANVSITPGICEQYADIKIYDRDGYFHNKSMNSTLDEATVEIKIKDVTNNIVVDLGTYITSKWFIEGDNSIIDVRCKDTSFLLEYIMIPASEIADRNIKDFLDIIFNTLPNFTFQFLDDETSSRCNQITVPNSWYNQTNLLELLNKVCSLGMLRMFYKQGTFYIARCL